MKVQVYGPDNSYNIIKDVTGLVKKKNSVILTDGTNVKHTVNMFRTYLIRDLAIYKIKSQDVTVLGYEQFFEPPYANEAVGRAIRRNISLNSLLELMREEQLRGMIGMKKVNLLKKSENFFTIPPYHLKLSLLVGGYDVICNFADEYEVQPDIFLQHCK